MINFRLSLFFSFLSLTQLAAQITPKEGSNLNYRIVGFSFPPMHNANNYHLAIATGVINNQDSFNAKIIISENNRTNRIIAEVPAFGERFTWQVIYTIGHANSVFSPLYHFSTDKIPSSLDTFHNRLRVINNSGDYKNALVFLDGNQILYDMTGQPVWFVPKFDSVKNKDCNAIRDMKITSKGTITVIICDDIYEIDYNGTLLWQGPINSKGNVGEAGHYHHEFSRITNGHYMALANEPVNIYIENKPSGDSILILTKKKNAWVEF